MLNNKQEFESFELRLIKTIESTKMLAVDLKFYGNIEEEFKVIKQRLYGK